MNNRLSSYATGIARSHPAETQPINKIVVVGHPLSGYEGVEQLLNRCGMQPASPTQRSGLSATEVVATLLKAHRVVPLQTLQTHGVIHPLQPGPIWQSLALDLLLGNLQHELWGWSDPQAVYLLDYWKNLDPQLAFMLVYDSPQELIARAFSDPAADFTAESLQVALDNWMAYNEALLHFFHRNPERCMLVHASRVKARASDYLEHVQARIGPTLSGTSLGVNPIAQFRSQLEPTPDDTHHSLRYYIAQELLTQQARVLQCYEELQAAASLPLGPTDDHPEAPPAADPALLAMQAIVTLQQQQTLQQLKLVALESEKADITARLSAQIEAEKTAHSSDAARIQQEAGLLLTQLYQVQEELERHYLENKQHQDKLASLSKEKAQTELLAAEQQQQLNQLQQQLQQAQDNQSKAASDSATTQEENDLLLAQLHTVQEELERYYLSGKKQAEDFKQQLATKEREAQGQMTQLQAELQNLKAAPPASLINTQLMTQLFQAQEEQERRFHAARKEPTPGTKVTAQKPKDLKAPQGAADRVKQQLSYRLGAKLIERSHSFGGWLGMPFALIGVARQYKRELPQHQAKKQVPIHKYRDAHEAERVKQHLSYRLGTMLIKHGKNPLRWPLLPFALHRARKAWLEQQAR